MAEAAALMAEARALRARAGFPRARSGVDLPPLLWLTDPARAPDPVAVARRLPRGCGVVLRHYDAPDRADLARRLAAVCRARGLVLLVGADAALAAAVGAHGVHLPEWDTRWGARRHEWRLLTAAAHSAGALRRAAGADAALLSPVFATVSHPGAPPLGPARFAELTAGSPLPVYALGGVTAAAAPALRGSGAAGIAAVGALAGLGITPPRPLPARLKAEVI